jgi:hypothetical protein
MGRLLSCLEYAVVVVLSLIFGALGCIATGATVWVVLRALGVI